MLGARQHPWPLAWEWGEPGARWEEAAPPAAAADLLWPFLLQQQELFFLPSFLNKDFVVVLKNSDQGTVHFS